MEINQFIRKYNRGEFDLATLLNLNIFKALFLKTHKFNNAKNKINLTNKYLYKHYKSLQTSIEQERLKDIEKDLNEIKRITSYGKNRLTEYFQENK